MKDIIEDKRTIKFSRIPVYEGNIDNIVGIVLTKKIFKQAINESEKTLKILYETWYFLLHENIMLQKH